MAGHGGAGSHLDALMTGMTAWLPAEPAVRAAAPGRVNLIGDHIDYCGGTVLPMAIERWCVAAVVPGQCEPDRFIIASHDVSGTATIPVAATIEPSGGGGWHAAVVGVAAQLQRQKDLDGMGGCLLAAHSSVPLGGGLSSSAALEVSAAMALAARIGHPIEGIGLAKLCQRAEHEFVGVPCGLMDQAASVLARSGHALLLDCASERFEHVPLDGSVAFSVVDSGIRHSLADGAYRERREACAESASLLGVEHLASVAMDRVDELPGVLRPFARHVVSEQARVRTFASAMAAGEYGAAGQAMLDSHRSLRDDYRVSCEGVDRIVESLDATPGVFGARMTGGGFGGCIVVLHAPGALPAIESVIDTANASGSVAGARLVIANAAGAGGAHLLLP